MAGEASVFQTGGGGFNYENYVQASFLLQMIINGMVPSFNNGSIIEIGFQNKNRGYQTDDLYLEIQDGSTNKRIVSQIKYNIPVSSKNEVFNEVIKAFWEDFNNSNLFDKQHDKMFLIKSSLTNNDKNNIVYLCQIASKQSNSKDFFSEINRTKIKKENLDIFRDSLNLAKGQTVTEEELFQFLKCFNLLAYDFTANASIDETYALNLIKISKSKDITTTSNEIWSVLLNEVATYNRNGGSISKKDLSNFQPYAYFDLSLKSDAYSSFNKIQQDGQLLLKPFKNTIKGYHIDRTLTRKLILESINQSDISIVTGYPGVGKSSIIKDIFNAELSDALPIIFKADQLNKTSLAQVFSEIGINHNLIDLFSLISTTQNKIIVIDSAEKLLEAQPDSAFKQLLSIVSNKGIKLLLTCRSYAVNIIKQKFSIDSKKINVVDIPLLKDEEIELVKKEFPQLTDLLSNTKINEVLRSPKYLDFTISAIKGNENISDKITFSEFKEILWNEVIENSTVKTSGLPRKRGVTFSHIAIGRAINMRLFFEPEDDKIHYEAIELLESDNVIVRNGNKFQFSPSHDILEDWALIRYISSIENRLANKAELFNELGNQPALRRAFRLWVEELLTNDIDKVGNLITLTIEDKTIPTYWTDEILTAVFRSDDCSSFFKHFSSHLLENDCSFLNRCILLIRTTCREYSFNQELSNDILFPVGSCWEESLRFLASNISSIANIKKSVSNFLLDWEYKFLFQFKLCSIDEIEAANTLVFHYIREMYDGSDHWGYSTRNDYQKTSFLYMLFGFAAYCKDDLKKFIEECSSNTDEYGRLNGFSELVIKKAFGGVRNDSLIKELPDTLIQIANKHWKRIPPERLPKREGPIGFSFPERKEREDAWGITKTRFEFFPSGIYKTFVFNLLRYHPSKAIVFICEFTNYITSFYKQSEFGTKDELKEIKITLNDGSENTIYGNEFLWNAYRGTIVTHYLLESILISLEKYLIEIAQIEIPENKLLKSLTDYLLKNSNSAAIFSVLTSVFIAYAKAFGDSVLPLLKIREFYEWDTHRATREHSATAIYDQQISYAQKEKGEFNRLPHRTKYQRGLREFLLHYQINNGLLNKDLQIIFDDFYENCDKEDIFWEKAITEMDIRKYKASIVDKDKGVFQLEVNYSEPINDAVQTFTEEHKNDNLSMHYSHLLRQAKEKKSEISFNDWETIYNHLSSEEIEYSMWDSPVTLAVLGFDLFSSELNTTQKEYCVKTIIEALQQVIKEANNRGSFGMMEGFNILEKQLTIESIHLLYEFNDKIIDENQLDILIVYLLTSHLADHEIRGFQKYFRNTFSKKFPQKANELIVILIKYAKFDIENRLNHYGNEQEIKEYREKQFSFIENSLLESELPEISSLTFDSHEAHFLNTSLLLIVSNTDKEFFQKYILKMCELILKDLKLEDDYSYSRSRKSRKTNHTILVDLRFFLNEVLLFNELSFSKTLIDILTEPILDNDFKLNHNHKDLYELVSGVFNTTVTRLDDVINENNDVEMYRNQFWELWSYLFTKVKEADSSFFIKELLLNVNERYWSIKSDNWAGFINHKIRYDAFAIHFKEKSLPHTISVFSTFGEKVFLPSGINLIVSSLKNSESNYSSLDSKSAVKLIQVLFNNHIQEIKENQSLIEDFVYILNKMIDLGYCEAYLIRECVITYKKSA